MEPLMSRESGGKVVAAAMMAMVTGMQSLFLLERKGSNAVGMHLKITPCKFTPGEYFCLRPAVTGTLEQMEKIALRVGYQGVVIEERKEGERG